MKLYARENFCVNKMNFKHGILPWALTQKRERERERVGGIEGLKGYRYTGGVNEFIPGD